MYKEYRSEKFERTHIDVSISGDERTKEVFEQIIELVRKENRRRRQRGDSPASYRIMVHSSDSTASISS